MNRTSNMSTTAPCTIARSNVGQRRSLRMPVRNHMMVHVTNATAPIPTKTKYVVSRVGSVATILPVDKS